MELKTALKKQYHASLTMLKECIEKCPDELWTERDHPRAFWRIVFHTLFYTHLYLQIDEASFSRWEKHRDDNANLWQEPWEPGTGPKPYLKQEILEYWSICNGMVDSCVDRINLDSPDSGFDWYPIPKLEHQLVNLRHIQGHVGQLSEILMEHNIDIDWKGTHRS